jgi:hypothetical protein
LSAQGSLLEFLPIARGQKWKNCEFHDRGPEGSTTTGQEFNRIEQRVTLWKRNPEDRRENQTLEPQRTQRKKPQGGASPQSGAPSSFVTPHAALSHDVTYFVLRGCRERSKLFHPSGAQVPFFRLSPTVPLRFTVGYPVVAPPGLGFPLWQIITQNPKVSDISIQPAQRLGAVSTGILPSQDAEKPSATDLHG